MTEQYRLATDLEIKHFKELIAPIDPGSGRNADQRPKSAAAAAVMVRKIMKELDRFGYMPHPVHLLVRIDSSTADVELNDEQTQAVKADMRALYGKLGVEVSDVQL